jgi:hypothetical protein
MKIEIDAETRTVRIAGMKYSFEFFEDLAALSPSDIIRIKHDFATDARGVQRVRFIVDEMHVSKLEREGATT